MVDQMDSESRAYLASKALDGLQELVSGCSDLGAVQGETLGALMELIFAQAKRAMPYRDLPTPANHNLEE